MQKSGVLFPCRAGLRSPLMKRLLLFIVAFVVVVELLLFIPSLVAVQREYFERVLDDAALALMAMEVAQNDERTGYSLQKQLLEKTEAYGVQGERRSGVMVTVGPRQSFKVDVHFDMDQLTFFSLMLDTVTTLVRREKRVMSVTGTSPWDPDFQVKAILPECPLSGSLRDHVKARLLQTLMISLLGALALFFVLNGMLVRPLRRLIQSITDFSRAPEDVRRHIRPSQRNDEIGAAERALAEMQCELRLALYQRTRLAAVGIGVSKISHDLKGILTTALLESDRLEGEASDPQLKHVTQGIARALERAVNMVASILSFAKEGPPVPKPRLVMLRTLWEEVCQGSLKGAGQEIPWDMDDPDDLWILADPGLTLRVVENLVRNAVEAGATMVKTQSWRQENRVFMRISDNGMGMPSKAVETLFMPFAGSAKKGGIGLGLPIARELMIDQGGTLDLENTSSQGTSFLLTFPAGGTRRKD